MSHLSSFSDRSNKSHKLILGITLLTLVSSMAFAAPNALKPSEVREKISRNLIDVNAKGKVDALKLTALIKQNMLQMTRGKISSTELELALKKSFSIKEDGIAQEVNLVEVSKTIEATRGTLEKLNRNELDADAQLLVQQLERGLEVTPRFLALAALTSKAGSNVTHVEAFAKELSLIKEILTQMKPEEAKSHLDVMELAVELKLRSPETTGDQAFFNALKDKYGEELASKKMQELLNCVR